jgi:hypothetical protein
MNSTLNKPLKCKCAASEKIGLGKTTKLPTKHTLVVSSKNHPKSPPPYATITLFKCEVCGQHWQADGMQGRVRDTISWPLVFIKVEDPNKWQRFDDYSTRKAFFPELDNGLKLAPPCATEKCKDTRVRGLNYCAVCTIKLRAAGASVLGFSEPIG